MAVFEGVWAEAVANKSNNPMERITMVLGSGVIITSPEADV